MHNDTSAVNTILIVALLVAVVGGLVWYVTQIRTTIPADTSPSRDINVDVQLPDMGTPSGGTEQQPSSAPGN